MEPGFIEWLVGQAGLAGVAALALYYQHQGSERLIALIEELREEQASLKQVVEKNTEVIGAVLERLRGSEIEERR